MAMFNSYVKLPEGIHEMFCLEKNQDCEETKNGPLRPKRSKQTDGPLAHAWEQPCNRMKWSMAYVR